MVDPKVASYLREIGRRGGQVSRRRLDRRTAQRMVAVREARRAFREFYTMCFWSCDPEYHITDADIPWVADRLKRYGGRRGWEIGARLCR